MVQAPKVAEYLDQLAQALAGIGRGDSLGQAGQAAAGGMIVKYRLQQPAARTELIINGKPRDMGFPGHGIQRETARAFSPQQLTRRGNNPLAVFPPGLVPRPASLSASRRPAVSP